MASIKLGLILLLAAYVYAQIELEFVEVELPVGKIRGIKERSSVQHHPFYSFRGVPFAGAPVGEYRYKAAPPVEHWDGVRDTVYWGSVCHQYGPDESETEMPSSYFQRFYEYFGADEVKANLYSNHTEDCLNLNVFTRSVPIDENAKLPVMVYYHGGSFTIGGSYVYFPDLLLDHEMILVVPHYRLGPLGFLNMNNDDIPGNAAMLDQIAALEWVRDNIHLFGGDKDQVTIFGESAGAVSVSFLALSPLQVDENGHRLFHRVIGQSGAALALWAFDRNPEMNARGVAEKMGCPDLTNDEAITRCLIEVEDPGYLNDAHSAWSNEQKRKGVDLGFGGTTPSVQKAGSRIFLDRTPEETWADPTFESVPAIFGANKHEGTMIMGAVIDDYIRPNGLYEDQDFMKYGIVTLFGQMFGLSDNAYVVADAVEYEYIGADRMGNITAMSPGLIDFSGAIGLKAPGWESVKLHSKFGPSYAYAFNLCGRICVPLCIGIVGGDYKGDYPFPHGVCHAAEIPMLFGVPGIYKVMSRKEKKLARQMSKMWYNFAKYGDPTTPVNPVEDIESWPAWDPENQYYINLERNINIASDYTRAYTVAKDEGFGLV